MNKIPNLNELDFFAFRDYSKLSSKYWAVQNGIIYSKKNLKILKNAIDLIVNHCKIEFYGTQCVDVSATTVLGKALMRNAFDYSSKYNWSTSGELCIFKKKCLESEIQEELEKVGYDTENVMGFVMDIDDSLISLRKPSKGGDIESLGLIGTNNYVNMWLNRDMYDKEIKFKKKYYYC